MNLYKIIEKIALKFASDEKMIKPGHNGPYHHQETILRNYSHWIIIFSKLNKEKPNEIYLEAIKRLSNYFFKKEARPLGFSFHHRNVYGKDSSNGLIGQAWTFEALYECYETLKDDKFITLAEEVFNLHKFDVKNGLWYTLDIDGKVLEIDAAFNHQLWFAYTSAQVIPKNNKNFKNIEIFLNQIEKNLKVLDNGLVYHPIERYALSNLLKTNETFFNRTKRIIKTILIKKSFKILFVDEDEILKQWERSITIKSFGYHAFNMYAFVKFEKFFSDHSFWKSKSYQKMIEILLDPIFLDNNENNKYSYPYNPTGFEIAYVLNEKLSDKNSLELVFKFINKQFNLNFNYDTFMFSKNNEDPDTLTARLYELVALPPEILKKISITKKGSDEK